MSIDKASFTGVILALGGVLAGLLLEGGNLGQILQPTAAIIVFGGTLGAVMLQFPLAIILLAFRQLGSVFVNPQRDQQAIVRQLVQYAQKARREGIVSLDAELPQIEDTFLRKSLMLAVDGTEPQELRKMMEHGTRQSSRVRRASSPGIRIRRRLRSHSGHSSARCWD